MLALRKDLITKVTSNIKSKREYSTSFLMAIRFLLHFCFPRFLDSHNIASSTQVKRVALFCAGRAGSIHLANIVANPRIELAYVVESDSSSWEACRAKWNLGASKTTFLHPDNVAEVYADGTVDACVICTPTFTHEGFIVGSLQ